MFRFHFVGPLFTLFLTGFTGLTRFSPPPRLPRRGRHRQKSTCLPTTWTNEERTWLSVEHLHPPNPPSKGDLLSVLGKDGARPSPTLHHHFSELIGAALSEVMKQASWKCRGSWDLILSNRYYPRSPGYDDTQRLPQADAGGEPGGDGGFATDGVLSKRMPTAHPGHRRQRHPALDGRRDGAYRDVRPETLHAF